MTTADTGAGEGKRYDTGPDQWAHGEPASAWGRDWQGRPMRYFYGPCPQCGSRTFSYGASWACLDDYCGCSSNQAVCLVKKTPEWWNTDINVKRDGDAWCAYRDGFVNLQESEAGFGRSPQEAVNTLLGVPA